MSTDTLERMSDDADNDLTELVEENIDKLKEHFESVKEVYGEDCTFDKWLGGKDTWEIIELIKKI